GMYQAGAAGVLMRLRMAAGVGPVADSATVNVRITAHGKVYCDLMKQKFDPGAGFATGLGWSEGTGQKQRPRAKATVEVTEDAEVAEAKKGMFCGQGVARSRILIVFVLYSPRPFAFCPPTSRHRPIRLARNVFLGVEAQQVEPAEGLVGDLERGAVDRPESLDHRVEVGVRRRFVPENDELAGLA